MTTEKTGFWIRDNSSSSSSSSSLMGSRGYKGCLPPARKGYLRVVMVIIIIIIIIVVVVVRCMV